MILFVDIGNSRLKWGCFQSTFKFGNAISHLNMTPDHVFNQAFENVNHPERVFVANVASHLFADRLSSWVNEHWGCPCYFLKVEKNFKTIKNGYQHSEQLGIDRWLYLIGGRRLVPKKDLAIVSLGTALTVDVLTKNDQHQGGLIVPGLRLLQESMMELTHHAGDKIVTLDQQNLFLGQDTLNCIQQGSAHMLIGFVNQVMTWLENNISENIHCLLTGGNADQFMAIKAKNYQLEEHLIFHGMIEYAETHNNTSTS